MLKIIRTLWLDATAPIPSDEGSIREDRVRNIVQRQARGNVSAKQGRILTAADIEARKAALAKTQF